MLPFGTARFVVVIFEYASISNTVWRSNEWCRAIVNRVESTTFERGFDFLDPSILAVVHGFPSSFVHAHTKRVKIRRQQSNEERGDDDQPDQYGWIEHALLGEDLFTGDGKNEKQQSGGR